MTLACLVNIKTYPNEGRTTVVGLPLQKQRLNLHDHKNFFVESRSLTGMSLLCRLLFLIENLYTNNFHRRPNVTVNMPQHGLFFILPTVEVIKFTYIEHHQDSEIIV